MELWNRRYTRLWLYYQQFKWWRFAYSVDGAQLQLLEHLSFNDFKLEFLRPGEVIPKSDWIRLKELTKSLGSEEVRWPAIPV